MIGEGHRWVLLLRVPAKNTSKIPPVAHQVVDPYVDLHHVTGRPPFEHIGLQLADALDEWQEEGGHPDLLSWCAYLVSFAGWWKGRLDAEAAGVADGSAAQSAPR